MSTRASTSTPPVQSPQNIPQSTTFIPSGDITPTSSGKVNPNELNTYIKDWVSRSSLNGFVPADGDKYGLDGSPQSWANFFTKLAKKESSFDINRVGDVGKYEGGSRGLFQLSPKDALNHRLQSTPFSFEQLRDPLTNTNVALTIAEKLLKRDGIVTANRNGTWLGLSAYWGPLRSGWKPQ